MIQAYPDHGDTDTAVFELFVRSLPPRCGFLLAAGLQQALDFLEGLRFSVADIDWLKSTGRFHENLLDYLADFRFSGEFHAVVEGTAFFPSERCAFCRAAAAGAARRIAADQHAAFSILERRQGGALRARAEPRNAFVSLGCHSQPNNARPADPDAPVFNNRRRH